jgi:TolB protein
MTDLRLRRRRARRMLAPPVAALALVLPAPAEAAFPGANGAIAFGWYDRREDELGLSPWTLTRSIDVARPGGSGRRSLRACRQVQDQPDRGDCSIEYRSPAWSPSGRLLAFDAGTRLALMRSDGTGFRLLEQQSADDGEPAWSPGGRRLVFSGARAEGGETDLYVLDLASGRATRLTEGRAPAWSSRNLIAFTRGGSPDRPGTGGVYALRPAGGRLRRVVARGSDPTWSPRGARLAFLRRRPGGHSRLYTARADGSGVRRVPTDADNPYAPSWSPDGRQIAYTSFEGTIVAQRLDGRRVRQVAAGGFGAEYSFGAGAPDWRPLPRQNGGGSR